MILKALLCALIGHNLHPETDKGKIGSCSMLEVTCFRFKCERCTYTGPWNRLDKWE